jgi:radical SAM superfamily enzyme YgiQ (UPF0313 family)
MRKKTIYLINPKNDFPDYYGGEIFSHEVGRAGVTVSDLAITTVATLMRPYFDIKICEAHIEPIDYNINADFIGITGKITQWENAKKIAQRFRKSGKTIIIGGPYASLSPDTVRPYADILVIGEIEEMADEIFREIVSGKWKDTYEGSRTDLSKSVVPSWDLYPNHRSLGGNLQISRGCPFKCEFCDVIQYLGRKQRHKPVGKVIEELDYLHKMGYYNSFISDDNFAVYKSRAKEILHALKDWNQAIPGRTHKFITQVSMDVTKDDEMLSLLNEAGFSSIFTGIETPNTESLKETGKLQNTRIDLINSINKIYRHGIVVIGGMIVGFDNDKPDIFMKQFEFAMQSSIPYFSLNYLSAYESTPLFARLKKDNRIIPDKERYKYTQFSTNVRLKNINSEEQYYGMRWLISNLYAPQNYGERMCSMIDKLGEIKVPVVSQLNERSLSISKDVKIILRKLRARGEAENLMVRRVMYKIKEKPSCASIILGLLFQYAQVRFLLDQQPKGMEMYFPEEIGKSPFTVA